MSAAIDSEERTPRVVAISLGWGALAGAAAAVALVLILGMQHVVWEILPVADSRWYIALAVFTGGVLIALLRRHAEEADLHRQITEAEDPLSLRRRRVLVLTASAMIAVGFGGPIGPEAGLIGVVAELSAIVSHRIARTKAEARLIGTTGTAAALAGLYGSPPAGAAYRDDTLAPGRGLTLLAATSGFFGFLVTLRLLGSEGIEISLPEAGGRDLTRLLAAVPAAALGAAVAIGFRALHPVLARLAAASGGVVRQTLIGSALLALLLSAWPLLRFSGHHEMHEVAELASSGAWLTLLALGALKALALALALSAGWRGGEFFPIVFAGAAAGGAALAVVPGLDASAALVAGLAAAATIAMAKPLAVLLICVLLFPGVDLGPLLVGVGLGMVLLRLVPLPSAHGEEPADEGGSEDGSTGAEGPAADRGPSSPA